MTLLEDRPDRAAMERRLRALEVRLGAVRHRPRPTPDPLPYADPGAALARLRAIEYRLDVIRRQGRP